MVCRGCGRPFDAKHPEQTRCAECVMSVVRVLGDRTTPEILAILQERSGWGAAVSLDQVLAILNEILEAEPKAVTALFQYRMLVTGATIQNHPNILLYPGEDGDVYLGLLGILNALFGLKDGHGAISIQKKGETGVGYIMGFVKTADLEDRLEDVPEAGKEPSGDPANAPA